MGLNGAEIVYALKKAGTWGTAVAAVAGDGFMGLPASLDPDNELIVDDSLGQFFVTDATPGATKLEPTVSGYLRYNDDVVLSMLAAVMGTAGVPVTHSAGTLSKDHVLKVAKNTDGLFFTLAAKIGTGFVEEVPSWKIAKCVLTFETGKPVQFAFSGPGNDLVADSTVNTLTTFLSVTILEPANRAYMGQVVARINDASGIALAVGDKVGASKIVVTLERKLTGVYGSYVDSIGRDLIDEPTNDGLWTGSVSITLPRLKDNTGRLKIKGNTSRKMDITVTGPIIEGAIPYLFLFQFPNLKPKKNSNPHKQGILDNTWDFEILGATAAPTGMAGITDPLWITLTNKITTDLLVGP
jgi:hypothetical protein